MKKIIIGVLLIAVIAFGGAMVYIPSPDESFPKDYTVEEYKENIQKNRDLIVSKLEEIDKPTLEETLQVYAKEADTVDLYPTAGSTIEEAGTLFFEKDKLLVFKEWRAERFMQKNYANAYEYQKQFEETVQQTLEKGETPKEFSGTPYTYKDGSTIQFNGEGMSVEYAD